jgi:uncharacterized secreted protein with C-terminal beta-propeller domain
MVLMMEYMVAKSHSSFMEVFAPATRFDISDEDYHELRLELKRLVNDNKNFGPSNFEDVEKKTSWMMILTFLFNVVKIKAGWILSSKALLRV